MAYFSLLNGNFSHLKNERKQSFVSFHNFKRTLLCQKVYCSQASWANTSNVIFLALYKRGLLIFSGFKIYRSRCRETNLLHKNSKSDNIPISMPSHPVNNKNRPRHRGSSVKGALQQHPRDEHDCSWWQGTLMLCTKQANLFKVEPP